MRFCYKAKKKARIGPPPLAPILPLWLSCLWLSCLVEGAQAALGLGLSFAEISEYFRLFNDSSAQTPLDNRSPVRANL